MRELQEPWRDVGTGVAMGLVVGPLTAVVSAAFVWLLHGVAVVRGAHPNLVFGLPVAGLALGLVHRTWAKPVLGGTNLVLEAVHETNRKLPLRLGPVVFAGSAVTHLFGGSAGREGAAVQMGAVLSEALVRLVPALAPWRRHALIAGMAGGFASVFGTPMAAAVFSMEVLCVGRWNYASFLPAMVAALAGHWASLRLGVEHTDFPTLPPVELSVLLAAKWIVFAVGLWAVVLAFVVATHAVAHTSAKLLPHESLRMGAGGAVVVLAWLLVGTDRYLGLGMPTILQAVHGAELPFATFALKALFTAVTVGVGFMGGEVTPLFFIGATYGLTAGHLLGIPGPLAAAVGLSAAYGIAANTPVAFLFLAVELFGRSAMPHTSLVLALGFVLMRGKSIFSSQRHAHA